MRGVCGCHRKQQHDKNARENTPRAGLHLSESEEASQGMRARMHPLTADARHATEASMAAGSAHIRRRPMIWNNTS